MRRIERLLDLIALFAGARRPVTLEELREAFPDDYGGPGDESARRKLERDKADLLALGIPLRYQPPDEDHEEGSYLVDREQLFLPPLDLSPDQLAVVYLAGLALAGDPSFPYRDALATALGKLELVSDRPAGASEPLRRRVLIDHGARAGDEELRERLGAIDDACTRRKRLRFLYRARGSGQETAREVDPYGLFCRRGVWSLVGFSQERRATRVFLVDRMRELAVSRERPGTPDFEVPSELRLADYARLPAWRYEVGEPVRIELELDPEIAWLGEQALRVRATLGREGWRRFSVEATNVPALVEWVLGMGPRARVIAPAELCAEVRATLEALLARADETALARGKR